MFVKPYINTHGFRVLLLLTALTAAGCSHQVLTFFFTGVPDPGAEQADEAAQTATLAATSAGAPKRTPRVLKIDDFVHGPFGAAACNLCHLDPGKRNVSASAARSTPRPGQQLAYPLETLCAGCHSEKAATAVAASGLWQHGPVANGWCTSCHNPHKTRRQYMLTLNTNVAMCGQCHAPAALQQTSQHASNPAADCLGCHNPHAGRSRFLLKAEYDERERFGGS